MTTELRAFLPADLTLYAILIRANGDVYSPSQGWGGLGPDLWGYNAISLTEQTAGVYFADMPAVAAGVYSYVVYEQAGVEPAATDEIKGSGYLLWDGTAEADLAAIATAVDSTLTAAHNAGSWAGLTAQQVRDAAKLAPSAGAATAGSIDAKLADMPATILTTVVAPYAGTPGTFGYLLSLLAGLDFTAVNLVAASNAGEITIKRTLTLAAVVSGLTIPADWTACYWTVKRSVDDTDADALVQILVSNPGDPDDGVQVLMGTALDDESDGSLAVNQALGTVTIALGDASTALLEDAVELVWDVKVHAPAGKVEPGAGTATITTAVTRT